MSVTDPRGFLAAGVAAGMKASGRPDLGLLVSEAPASAAGLFTTNAFPAAPVVLSRRHLAGGRARGVVVNSGQANAGTGPAGLADALVAARETAGLLGAATEEVMVCSTGVIGPRVEMPELRRGLPAVHERLSPGGGSDFAHAILTTDTRAKESAVEAEGFTVGGCAKGAGMVAPDLATMLVFLTTDAGCDPVLLDAVARRSVAPVFAGITVDGCSSTNDTVLVLANGASGVDLGPGQTAPLERALAHAARDLARQIVLDAEGVTKALVVQVSGAGDDHAARAVGKAVAGSLLVKTAVFGGDPNPGRLLQALGAAGVPIDPHQTEIRLAGQPVAAGGRMLPIDDEACREALKEPEIVVQVGLGSGEGAATVFGCDLGYEYVRINGEYRT